MGDASKRIRVDDLLGDLLSALGHAHRRLQETSASESGSLGVDGAEVVVDLEIEAERIDAPDGPDLFLRPAGDTDPPSANHIQLRIRVAAHPPASDEVSEGRKPKKGRKERRKKPARPSVDEAADEPAHAAVADRPAISITDLPPVTVGGAMRPPDADARAAEALQSLRDAVERRGVLSDRPQVRRRLDDALDRYRFAPSADTRGAVLELIRPEWRRGDFVPPLDLLRELGASGLLDALADEDRRFRDTLAPALRQLITMVDAFDLGADTSLAFHQGIDEVLSSVSQTEARGRLVAAVQRLRRDAADQPLPPALHQFLEGFAFGS